MKIFMSLVVTTIVGLYLTGANWLFTFMALALAFWLFLAIFSGLSDLRAKRYYKIMYGNRWHIHYFHDTDNQRLLGRDTTIEAARKL